MSGIMRTFGVEEELLLVDPDSGRPRALIGRAVPSAAGGPSAPGVRVEGGLDTEFQRQQLETRTEPVSTLAAMRAEVVSWRRAARELGARAGADVAAVGTSPIEPIPLVTPGERYDWMAERYQLTAREHLTCGLHVHVSVESDAEGVGVLDRIRQWLPVLLALSTNSPFWQGRDTGYASYRSQAMARWPSTGPLEVLGTAEAYHGLVEGLLRSEVILDPGMVYFDARLSEHYPTVEVRVADVCLRCEDSVTVAGLTRALVETAARSWSAGEPAPMTPVPVLRCAMWQAGRYGMSGTLLGSDGRPHDAWAVVAALMSHVENALVDLGDHDAVREGIDGIRRRGTGADVQRASLATRGSVHDVVTRAVAETAR
jgi:carboxylate-amine ligase